MNMVGWAGVAIAARPERGEGCAGPRDRQHSTGFLGAPRTPEIARQAEPTRRQTRPGLSPDYGKPIRLARRATRARPFPALEASSPAG